MGKKTIFAMLLFAALAALCPSETTKAGTYDNAYTYYAKYGSESSEPARFNNNDGYIYFCSRGLTASTNTQYRTVGYTITVNAGNKKDSVEVKLGGTYVKEISNVKKDGYTYVLRRAKLSRLQSLFNGNNAITWNQIYCDSNTYRFDAIMTVVENGKQLCGTVRESDNYRKISADNGGYLFRDAAGIKNARKWAKPSDLNSFFNKSVVFSPVSYIKARGAYAEGENGNVFFDGANYYVRKNSVVRLAFESYFDDAEDANAEFHPNYNMYHITGWGDNQKYFTKQKSSGERSGIIKDGTGTEKPLTVLGTVPASTTSYSDSHNVFRSMARFNFNTADGGVTYAGIEGRVYYDYNYPSSISDDANLCNKSNSQQTLTLISDAAAPQIYLPAYVDEMRESHIPVSAADGGSGIRSIALCRNDGAVVKQLNFSGRNTLVSSDNDFPLPYDDYKYFIRAYDNVGNVCDSEYITFTRPRAHTVEAFIAGGINGYNSTNITANVHGGNSEIAALTIMSDIGMNPTLDRVVFVNQSVMAHTMASGQYAYKYSLNPMYSLNGKPDGEYKIDVISGGKYVSSDPVLLVLKKDTTSPAFTRTPNYDQKRWFRGDQPLTVNATDNYSGVSRMSVRVNGQELKGQISQNGGAWKGYYTIRSEGTNYAYVSVGDLAGNVNTQCFTYLIDRTPPRSTLSKTFAGLDKENDVWLNKEGLKGEISITDSASGMSKKKANYELIERTGGSATIVKFDDIYDIKVSDGQTAVISFSDAFIDTLSSSKHIYMVDTADVAENWKTTFLYLNIDVDAPTADYECGDPWDGDSLKGNIRLADEHSGVASAEVFQGESCIWSLYGIDRNEHVISLDLSEYEGSSQDIFLKVTDRAGNVADFPLVEGTDIQLRAYVLKYNVNEEPVFYAGENAMLKIEYSGDADVIKVFYPDALTMHDPDLDTEYDVSERRSLYLKRGFIIPIKTENGPYHVTVTACKGDREYTVYPSFEVRGHITEQFRTRIR